MQYTLGFMTILHHGHIRQATSLTAKKTSKKKTSNTARTTKGFGAPPPPTPTFEEFVSKYRTRIPSDPDNQPCPCGGRSATEKLYGQCCGQLHRGERLALTTTDVLRSRYSAFSWRLIKYVIESTHESSRDYLENKVDWAKSLHQYGMFDSFDFVRLEPGPEEKSDVDENEGFIKFNVVLRANDDSALEGEGTVLTGKETKITERSKFIRDPNTGVWSYASGDIRSNEAGLEGMAMN